MGGLVITQTAQHVHDKIEKLVYLCAFLPKNGESLVGKSEGEKGPETIRTNVRLTYCVNDRAQQVLVLNSFGLHL
jgi:hypothetical protein